MSDVPLIDRLKRSVIEVGSRGEFAVLNRGEKNNGEYLNYHRQLLREKGPTFSFEEYIEWSRQKFSSPDHEADLLRDGITNACKAFAQNEVDHLTEDERRRLEAFKREGDGEFADCEDSMWLGWLLAERELDIRN